MLGDGFWDVTASSLDAISNTIAAQFYFTAGQASSL